MSASLRQPVAFVLKGYPRLSESFIAQEIHGLEQRGLPIHIISLRHPTDVKRHPVHGQIKAQVTYLPEYLHQEPLRVFAGWRHARKLPGYARAFACWLRDLKRDMSRNRVRRFGQAMTLAREIGDFAHLHAHFLHTPASVTRYTAMMLERPWTFSAHARDIWTSPDWELREKLVDCDWGVTCTAVNHEHLNGLAAKELEASNQPVREVVELMYHGLDLTRFSQLNRQWSEADGSSPDAPVQLLSVGRAVEKKGYDDLLDALGRLPSSSAWQLTHIGGGPELKMLKQRAEQLGISDRITWLGARAQEEVLAAYQTSDLFLLASKVAGDGDRDGLPNVIVEAQSQGLAVVATNVSAIPELIRDGVNGRLVSPAAPEELSEALQEMIAAPDLRRAFGQAGMQRVHGDFSMDVGVERLTNKLVDAAKNSTARQAVATSVAGGAQTV